MNYLNKKTICFISTNLSTLNAFVRDQSIFLLKNGWEITWIAGENQSFEDKIPKEVKFIAIPITRKVSLIQFLRTTFILFKIFRNKKFNIIQYCTPIASLASSVASFGLNSSVKVYSQWGLRYEAYSGLKRLLFKNLEKITCSISTYIQPDSFGNLEFSVEEGLYPHSKGEVIGNGSANGVDFKKFNYKNRAKWRKLYRKEFGISLNDFVFGYVGSITKDKGIDEVISAFSEISKIRDNIWLLLIGDSDFSSTLKKTTLNTIVTNKKILQLPPKNNIEEFFSIFDCSLLYSYREGFGSVVIESAAMKIPSIVSDIRGPNESVINDITGWIIPKKNSEILSSKMLEVVMNSKNIHQIGENALKHVKKIYNKTDLLESYIANKNELFQRLKN